MTECQGCGKLIEDLYAVPGEYGKIIWLCDACAGGETKAKAICENAPDASSVRCPMCESSRCKDASEVDKSLDRGELFRCECSCVFDMRKSTRRHPI